MEREKKNHFPTWEKETERDGEIKHGCVSLSSPRRPRSWTGKSERGFHSWSTQVLSLVHDDWNRLVWFPKSQYGISLHFYNLDIDSSNRATADWRVLWDCHFQWRRVWRRLQIWTKWAEKERKKGNKVNFLVKSGDRMKKIPQNSLHKR